MNENVFHPDQKMDDYFVHIRSEMLTFIPASARTILDVGCGSGNFGSFVKSERKAEVWGVECSPEAAREARYRLDRVFQGDIEQDNLALPEDYFDCIVFNDVLEHLKYPWIVLSNAKALLKNGGCVIASIPNVRYCGNIHSLLVRKNWEYQDDGILDKTHLRFFTERSIKEMFINCGYAVLRMEGLRKSEFSKKLKLLNFLLRNSLDDMKYLQFAVLAKKISGGQGE